MVVLPGHLPTADPAVEQATEEIRAWSRPGVADGRTVPARSHLLACA